MCVQRDRELHYNKLLQAPDGKEKYAKYNSCCLFAVCAYNTKANHEIWLLRMDVSFYSSFSASAPRLVVLKKQEEQ